MTLTAQKRATGFDALRAREDFPILSTSVHGKPLVYLDSAATTQKPRCVIERLRTYYESENANIHRGIHRLSEQATRAYEDVRLMTARFINAATPEEIVFVRGTTEGINLVAQSFVRPKLSPGDEILITTMEHHSNIVPWQILREQTGAVLRVAPISDSGELIVEEFEKLLGPRTKFASISHVSNALGTINPVRDLIEMAHRRGVPVLVDGAQAVAHLPVDVRALGCDFYVFSGHKTYGPTGVGVLYGTLQHLNSMPPYQGGGEMILSVTFEKTTFQKAPHRFEAGTPNIAGVIGLGAAIDYLKNLDGRALRDHEQDLLTYGTQALTSIAGLRIVGTAPQKSGVISFTLEGIHPHDIGTILDQEGIAIRTGHHCAQPVMERFGIPATARASFALYNTRQDVDALVPALERVRKVFGT